MPTDRPSKVCICCSGGIDSSALIVYYREQGYEITVLHFDYGHPAFKEEKKALNLISHHFQIQASHLKIRPLVTKSNVKNGELIGRNALFILSALNYFSEGSGLISLGIHSGPPAYYDCSPVFVENMQSILDGYLGGTVILDAPFLEFQKSDVISWARENHVPLELTYSCLRGLSPPCGQCPSCLERKNYAL